ncbi:MAG: endonuclease III [Thermoanaerobaculales bacterium]|nr:endonuclease III [Thermoanaerobaculales bacterium]
METGERAELVVRLLADQYPDAVCELDYRNPWELLVATVLSAQCTDERVNRVTPVLFERWPGPEELAAAPQAEVEDVVRPAGLHRSKAANLRQAARRIVERFGGGVPPDPVALVELPGVGRKTAKVVLGEAFGIAAGVAVDTHVRRLANRIGLSSSKNAEKVAGDLENLVPRERWINLSKRLVLHGRRVCSARKPSCETCVLVEVCRRIGL